MNTRINKVLRQSKWLALLACCFVAFSARSPEQEITLVQLSTAQADNASLLLGHWRKTVIRYGSVWDEHLGFLPDGSVGTWKVTVSGRGEVKLGRWRIEGKLLIIDWGDTQSSRPFFFHKGQLVLPNTPNARQFWDRLRS